MILEEIQLIDMVENIDQHFTTIVCRSQLPETSPVFDGHFPGWPILPGVFVIEAMAQAAGYLLLAKLEFSMMPFLSAVDSARFRSFSTPNDVLTITANSHHHGIGFHVFRTCVHRDNTKLADAEIKLAIRKFPNATMRRALRDRLLSAGAVAPDISSATQQ